MTSVHKVVDDHMETTMPPGTQRVMRWMNKRHLLSVLPLMATWSCYAEDDFTTWFSPEGRSYNFIDSSVTFAPDSDIADTNQEFRWSQYKLRGLTTVLHNEHSDWTIWGGLQRSELDTDVSLPDGSTTPDTVTNLRLGTTYRFLADSWMLGGSAVIQESDEDTFGGDDTGAQATVFGHVDIANEWKLWGLAQYEGITEDQLILGAGVRYHGDSSS